MELFTTEEQKIYTVTEITRSIKWKIEGTEEFKGVWIKGEIYNLTIHSSGHIYFSLKDDNAVINVTFFKNANKSLKFKLEEGMSVLALGNITLFEKRGSYQINVFQVRLEGIGELQKRIDQLKKKLQQEGIFDKAKKKSIPVLPKRIGVVTSPTGAAIRDIIKVALRRYPEMEIVIAPSKVQGDDAAVTIVQAIEVLNDPVHRIDVIIAGRGGGSFEDLMPFNEEIVVRAFFNSRVPIISAVGHQIDHPISDDAADLAAPTPSAAAELAVPIKKELFDEIEYLGIRMTNAVHAMIREFQMRLDVVTGKRVFVDPYEIVRDWSRHLSDAEQRIVHRMREITSTCKTELLTVPDISILMNGILLNYKHRFGAALNALEQLSPVSVIKRGYSIPLNIKGQVIRSIKEIKEDEDVNLQLADGMLHCQIKSIEKGGILGKNEN